MDEFTKCEMDNCFYWVHGCCFSCSDLWNPELKEDCPDFDPWCE